MSATNFGKAINNIACNVGSPYRAPSGSTLTLTAAHGIPSSTFDNSGWVRVTIAHAGIPKVILKATAAPSSTTLTISSPYAIDGTTDNYTCVNGDVAELRICAGAFSDIHTAVNNLESGTNAVTKIGNDVVSGTSGRVLFVDSNTHLAQDSGLTWNATDKTFAITTTGNYGSLYIDRQGTSAGGDAITVNRSTSQGNTLTNIAFVTCSTVSDSAPVWSMGVPASSNDYAFTSWNGSAAKTFIKMTQPSGTQKIGFFGVTPVQRPDITGSRGSNAALANLLTALKNLGLITDSSS